jgi:hypothetical protein
LPITRFTLVGRRSYSCKVSGTSDEHCIRYFAARGCLGTISAEPPRSSQKTPTHSSTNEVVIAGSNSKRFRTFERYFWSSLASRTCSPPTHGDDPPFGGRVQAQSGATQRMRRTRLSLTAPTAGIGLIHDCCSGLDAKRDVRVLLAGWGSVLSVHFVFSQRSEKLAPLLVAHRLVPSVRSTQNIKDQPHDALGLRLIDPRLWRSYWTQEWVSRGVIGRSGSGSAGQPPIIFRNPHEWP